MEKLIEHHYKKNSKRLCKVVARRFSDRIMLAEEAVQEAYLRAIKYQASFNPEIKGFEHWFSSILNNAVKDLQNEERSGGVVYDDEIDHAVLPPERIESRYAQVVLDETIAAHHEREILHHFFQLGLKPREICQIVDRRSLHAVKSVVYRFRKEFAALKL